MRNDELGYGNRLSSSSRAQSGLAQLFLEKAACEDGADKNLASDKRNGEECAFRLLADLDSLRLPGRRKPPGNAAARTERLGYKNDGSSVELRDGQIVRLTTAEGELVRFASGNDSRLKSITAGEGRLTLTRDDHGHWTIKERLPGGKEEKSEVKAEPQVEKDGSFSVETRDGIKKTFKTDGSIISKRADGHVIRVDFADGTSRLTTWKGEGKDARESTIITLRRNESRAEQIQAGDGGLFDRFTWKEGAAADKYQWEGKIDAVRTYPDGEFYTRRQGESRGLYERSDKSKVQLDDQERIIKLVASNGDVREFGYFDKGNEVKWARLPNGSYLTRESPDADFNFVVSDAYGQQTLSGAKLNLQVVDGIYRWYKTDGSDPHWHIFQSNGKERLVTDGGGRAVQDGSGKITAYVYAPSGRTVKLDSKGNPTGIFERDGKHWKLTDAASGQWTSDSGDKRNLTVSDGEYSYKDSDSVTLTFKRDGSETRKNADGTSITVAEGRIVSAMDKAGKVISYKYDGDKLYQVEDGNGTTWKRKTGSPPQWEASGKMSLSAAGDLRVAADGSFKLEGEREAKRLIVIRAVDGTTTESCGGSKTITRSDSSTTKIRYEGDADKSAVSTIARYTSDGKLALHYDRQPGATGLATRWKSDTGGYFEGEIKITPTGELLFQKLNSDQSVSTLAEDGRTVEKVEPDGVVRKFGYDKRGRLNAEFEFQKPDDKKPIVWQREGLTDLWKAADGRIWTGRERLETAGGILWQPKGKGDSNWELTRAGKTENLKGTLKVARDGSLSFEGTSGRQQVRLEYTTGGALIDRRADETNVLRKDGTATKIVYSVAGTDRKIQAVQEYDAGGHESAKYERKAGDSPFTTIWHSKQNGDFQGDINLNATGDILMSRKNSDGTVTARDLRDRLREQTYLDGVIRRFEYDPDGQMRQLIRSKGKDDSNPSIWRKQGNTDFWVSGSGVVWEARFEIKDGKFTITDEESRQIKQADGSESVDRSKKHIFSGQAEKQLANLLELAGEKVDDPAELTQFKTHLDQFAARAKEYGLSSAEVARTRRELARILVTPGETPLSKSEKILLVLHCVKHFADPTSTDQGYHNTCNVTTVETMLCTKQPSTVAKLLADVAATGQFVTADGSTIKLDPESLKPDNEANHRQPVDGLRSFASQLFQLTAVNIYWQRQSTMPDGTMAGAGNILFTQVKGPKAFPSDTKDRLIDRSTGHVLMQADSAGKLRPDDAPHLTLPPHMDIVKQITGREPASFVIANNAMPGAVAAGIVNFSSVDEMHTRLKELAEGTDKTADGATIPKLPIILAVHTSKPPFKGSSSEGGAGGYHVVTITAYDPVTGMVSLDNQWGRKWDHLGRPDGKQKIHIRDLYPATYL